MLNFKYSFFGVFYFRGIRRFISTLGLNLGYRILGGFFDNSKPAPKIIFGRWQLFNRRIQAASAIGSVGKKTSFGV